MATALRQEDATPPQTGMDDPFHDPLMVGIGIVVFLLAVVILALTGLIHWGVEYHMPPWNANSFPPPVVH